MSKEEKEFAKTRIAVRAKAAESKSISRAKSRYEKSPNKMLPKKSPDGGGEGGVEFKILPRISPGDGGEGGVEFGVGRVEAADGQDSDLVRLDGFCF